MKKSRKNFKRKNEVQLALDGGDNPTYIAPTMVNLNPTRERYPDVRFRKTASILFLLFRARQPPCSSLIPVLLNPCGMCS